MIHTRKVKIVKKKILSGLYFYNYPVLAGWTKVCIICYTGARHNTLSNKSVLNLIESRYLSKNLSNEILSDPLDI